jgi:LEA14-like dessication related protein
MKRSHGSKKVLIVLLILLALVVSGIWWWKSTSSDKAKEKAMGKVMPTIGVASTSITDIDDDCVKMVSKVTLYNPLPVDIKTKRLNYTIYVDSVKIMEDAYEKPISIRSSDSSTLTLPMQLLAKPTARLLKYFDDQKIDSADYAMKASFEVDVPIAGERKFDMNISRRLPALRIPKIKVKHVDLNAFSLKSKGMHIEVQVFNPNLFPLKMSDGKFDFSIEDAMEMSGVLEKIINVPAKGVQNVSLHARMTDGSVLKSGWKMLTDKKGTPFKAKFTGKMDSDNKMLSSSKMVTTLSGTLDELMNAAKPVR